MRLAVVEAESHNRIYGFIWQWVLRDFVIKTREYDTVVKIKWLRSY